MVTVDDRKTALESRMAEVTRRLRHIEDELDAPHSKDWDDLATEREEDEVLEGMGASGLAEIGRIRAALGRIAEGSYGFCVTCGAEISQDRLDVVPATPFCRNCAA